MSVVKTITDEYHFWDWLKHSDNYSKNFSLEGSKAVFNYFDSLSDELGEQMEFDPIAWCCEFAEYASLKEFNTDYNSENPFDSWDQVAENTTVIELDNGGAVVGAF
jgi:hypothetical protein